MGYVRVKGVISNIMDRSKCAEVEFVVDTDAMGTVVPGGILQKLDMKPTGEARFKLANGQVSNFPIGDAYIEVEEITRATTVIFGSEDAPALLGVTTLEQLGLEVDRVTGKLKPMELMLL
ncbi:MAG: Retroviral aspartyl protease [Chloroflexi bacterium]|nr:Retroviral aspartyl protease [Chloroflexota bacterium]